MAYDIYGDPQYWWLLMEYNGYVSWEDVRLNRRVRYFSLADLNTLYLSLAALQRRRDRG